MTKIPMYKASAALIFLAALLGLMISIYEYVTPLTGIDGSFGALLVSGSSLALSVDGCCLGYVKSHAWRTLWLVLGFLGALGTLAAGFFLHMPVLICLMAVVIVGLIINLSVPPHRTSVARG